MRKTLILMLSLFLVLSGCSSDKKRTDVVDVLIDNGYTRQDGDYYQKIVDNYKLKIGYIIPGKSNGMLSVQEYYSEGPYILVDYIGDAYFYFAQDEAYGFSRICGVDEEENELVTQALYYPSIDKWVVGYDGCELFVEEVDSAVEELVIYNGEIAKKQMELLDLSLKDLKTLGE